MADKMVILVNMVNMVILVNPVNLVDSEFAMSGTLAVTKDMFAFMGCCSKCLGYINRCYNMMLVTTSPVRYIDIEYRLSIYRHF